jgi:hypothetical protein
MNDEKSGNENRKLVQTNQSVDLLATVSYSPVLVNSSLYSIRDVFRCSRRQYYRSLNEPRVKVYKIQFNASKSETARLLGMTAYWSKEETARDTMADWEVRGW